MKVEPITLEGDVVRLEPMDIDHLEGLWEAGDDESLWRLIPTTIRSIDDMGKYVEVAIADHDPDLLGRVE